MRGTRSTGRVAAVALAVLAASGALLAQRRTVAPGPPARLVSHDPRAACDAWQPMTWEACQAMPRCDAGRVPREVAAALDEAIDHALDARAKRECASAGCSQPRIRKSRNLFACRGAQVCLTRRLEYSCRGGVAARPRAKSERTSSGPSRATPDTAARTSPAPSPPTPAAPDTGGPPTAAGGTQPSTPAGRRQVVDLTRIYRGDDGGALYLRRVGYGVFGFGEHPGQGYAFVLSGELDGERVVAKWWDVPKGGRTGRGSINLQWSDAGKRLVRKSGDDLGPDVFQALDADDLPWPGPREAGFQSTRPGDLNGAFTGDDDSAHYVRDIAGDVVWVAEMPAAKGGRPQWVTVFIGKRAGNGGIAGDYVDVPKGREATGRGRFGAATTSSDLFTRETMLTQHDVSRTRKLVPAYAIDFDRFEREIRDALDGKVVGYGYAIAQGSRIAREGGGGDRRTAQDGGRLAFTARTQNDSASTSKLVTAAVVMKTLEDRNISIRATVAGYLPSCWPKGIGINNHSSGLKLRDLLAHTSRLIRPGACDTTDRYRCLSDCIREGRTGKVEYQNINYTLFRYILPRIRNETVEDVFCPGGRDRPFDGRTTAAVNENVSERFARHVLDQVLAPLGIESGFEWTATEFALRYDFSDPRSPGDRPDTTDDYLAAGSGGMKWSAHDYVKFLAALETGKIVSPATLRTMKSELLGFDGAWDGAAGGYVTKNGGAGGAKGVQSQAMMFPSGVTAYVTINSKQNAYSGSLSTILGRAFDRAIR